VHQGARGPHRGKTRVAIRGEEEIDGDQSAQLHYPLIVARGGFLPSEADMGDDSNSTPDRYDAEINLDDETDVEEWCRSFACTAEELRAAVKAMGHSAKRVRVYLRDKQQRVE
jgi:hypothetical protein